MAASAEPEPQSGVRALLRHPSEPFDVYETYTTALTGTPPLPPALAAISALTTALSSHNLTTISEALSLLSTLAQTLKSRLANPLPASAGTDIFLHHLVTTVARPGALTGDFGEAIAAVTSVGEGFVRRGVQARERVKRYGRKVVRGGVTVVVAAVDELVVGMLVDAAEADVDFRVVFVEGAFGHTGLAEQLPLFLDRHEVPWCSVAGVALADTMSGLLSGRAEPLRNGGSHYRREVSVLGSALALLPDGGVLAPMGTLQACMIAKALGVEVIIASEMSKAVRRLPSPVEQAHFRAGPRWSPGPNERTEKKEPDAADASSADVEITPPRYISAILTENGMMSTDAVAEESIKIWF